MKLQHNSKKNYALKLGPMEYLLMKKQKFENLMLQFLLQTDTYLYTWSRQETVWCAGGGAGRVVGGGAGARPQHLRPPHPPPHPHHCRSPRQDPLNTILIKGTVSQKITGVKSGIN